MVRSEESSVQRKRRSSIEGEKRPSILRLPIEIKDETARRIRSADALVALIRPAVGELLQEVMLSVLLNARGYLTHVAIVGIGTLSACIVHPRDVFRQAIARNAASIILVHTHPSGNPEPSVEDDELTHRVRGVGDLIGIPLLDHIILGEKQHWSFAERRRRFQLKGLGPG